MGAKSLIVRCKVVLLGHEKGKIYVKEPLINWSKWPQLGGYATYPMSLLSLVTLSGILFAEGSVNCIVPRFLGVAWL